MPPVFTAMKTYLQNRWGIPNTPEQQAARDAQRRQERDLASGARSLPDGMTTLVNALETGALTMRGVTVLAGGGLMSPLALASTTWVEVAESRFHALRVETITNGSENFLSTVMLNGIAMKASDPDLPRLVAAARHASGAPHRPSGLDVALDPATTRPRLRR